MNQIENKADAYSADTNQESRGFVIVNPLNKLVWSARDKRHVSLRGDFSTYSTAAKAEAAIRRTHALKHSGAEVGHITFKHGMASVELLSTPEPLSAEWLADYEARFGKPFSSDSGAAR